MLWVLGLILCVICAGWAIGSFHVAAQAHDRTSAFIGVILTLGAFSVLYLLLGL
jgi:hypothetical protein